MFTKTFTIDASGDPEPIVLPGQEFVGGTIRKVTIREDDAGMTAGFKVRAPYLGSTAVQYQPGEAVVFEGQFRTGQTIGYMESDSGSLTMSMIAE